MDFYSQFSLRTSIHGFLDIYRSRNLAWKAFWLLLTVGSIGGAGYEIYMVIQSYINMPVITTYEAKSAETLRFPTVQICSSNVVNISRVLDAKIHPVVISVVLGWFPDFNKNVVFNVINKNKKDQESRGLTNELYFQYVLVSQTKCGSL